MSKYRPISERLDDFKPVELRLPPEELADGMRRCQDCGIPFCHASGCALTNAIPEINAHALAGRWENALAVLLDSSPFPEFTARVCPSLCEGSCVQGLYEDPVPCRQIELEVIERGFARGLVNPRPPRERNGLAAAVVGSGPAGLAAAWRLNRAGFRTTVFESDARAGGFLRYGIPDFKLDKEVVERRLDILVREGVTFECGVEAGRDVSGKFLKRNHDLIVFAGGARRKRDLIAPGRELAGIAFAVDYLSAQNRVIGGESPALHDEFNAKGRKVAVIGGGDTGSDCVGTALRQGAASVIQFEILPEPSRSRAKDNPWPEWPRIRRDSSSHEEGGDRRWGVTTLEFLPREDDRSLLGAIRCAGVSWLPGKGGRLEPIHRAESDFIQPADMVLLAMGFVGVEETQLFGDVGAVMDAGGKLRRDNGGRAAPGVYVAGDAGLGPSLVVKAIADGLAAAETAWRDCREGRIGKRRGKSTSDRLSPVPR